MNLEKIEALVRLVSKSHLVEFELTEGDTSIRLSKSTKVNRGIDRFRDAGDRPTDETLIPIERAGHSSTSRPDETSVQDRSVRSPMTGTFFRSSVTGEKELVSVGDDVVAGQVLCVIEAMKMLNQVEAEINGRLAKVLVENGAPVEQGQPLFVFE